MAAIRERTEDVETLFDTAFAAYRFHDPYEMRSFDFRMWRV